MKRTTTCVAMCCSVLFLMNCGSPEEFVSDQTSREAMSNKASSKKKPQPGCRSNSDCATGLVCDVTTGSCEQCLTSADCLTSPYAAYGSYCNANHSCSCNDDSHCASGLNGTRCNTFFHICQCTDSSQCTNGQNGSLCVVAEACNSSGCAPRGQCTCRTDADCTNTAQGRVCLYFPDWGDLYYCGCRSNADCTAPLTCNQYGECR